MKAMNQHKQMACGKGAYAKGGVVKPKSDCGCGPMKEGGACMKKGGACMKKGGKK